MSRNGLWLGRGRRGLETEGSGMHEYFPLVLCATPLAATAMSYGLQWLSVRISMRRRVQT